MKRFGVALVVLAATALVALPVAGDDLAMDEKGAIERARTSLGLSEAVAPVASADRVVLDAETVPFLAKDLEGQTTWRVHFPRLNSVAGARIQVAPLGSLTAILAPTTGQILRVAASLPGLKARDSLPSVSVEERQLTSCAETLTALPRVSPSVTFVGALEAIAKGDDGVVGPLPPARQFVAYHVTHDTVRYKTRAVWIVHLRGLPVDPGQLRGGPPVIGPDGKLGPGATFSEVAKNHLRHVVDATTGEWLSADTVPQPK